MFQGRNLRRHRISAPGSIYSITTCTYQRQPLFRNFYLARTLINALKYQDGVGRSYTYAFVVMPDHFHWLFRLECGSLNKVIHSVKSYVANMRKLKTWQAGYYEHVLRSESELFEHSRYIVANPLRAGLTEDIRNYAHWDAVWLNGGL